MPELQVLGTLVRSGQRFTTYGLAGETKLSITTVSDALKRFVERGYAERDTEQVNRAISERVPRTFYRSTTGGHDVLAELRALVST